jgi:hypothetical protein
VRWTPEGYATLPHGVGTALRVLTPPSIVAAIRQGYVVSLHRSALESV